MDCKKISRKALCDKRKLGKSTSGRKKPFFSGFFVDEMSYKGSGTNHDLFSSFGQPVKNGKSTGNLH